MNNIARILRILGFRFYTCEGGNPVDNNGDLCSEDDCQACCPHDEYDHDMCLYCGYERDPGEAIDAAMDRFED